MTKDKIVEINCSPAIKSILCEALKSYASIYNKDDSSHYYYIRKSELLGIIDSIEQQFNKSSDCFSINDNTQAYLEAAICYHYEHIHQQLKANVDQQKHLLLDALHGIPVNDQQLDDALVKDNII